MLFTCPKTPEERKAIEDYRMKYKSVDPNPNRKPLTPEELTALKKELHDITLARKGVKVI